MLIIVLGMALVKIGYIRPVGSLLKEQYLETLLLNVKQWTQYMQSYLTEYLNQSYLYSQLLLALLFRDFIRSWDGLIAVSIN